jgi:hypothetical protein
VDDQKIKESIPEALKKLPPVGALSEGSEIATEKGKMVFGSKSEPFEKDGKMYRRYAIAKSKKRQTKKEAMRIMGFNGKQLRKYLHENRLRENGL